MGLLSAAELAGFEVFGEQERVVHGERILEPAVGGNVMRSLLRRGEVESEERVAEILAAVGIRSKTAQMFVARREVARLPDALGGSLEARPIIPGLEDDSLSNYEGSDGGYEFGVMHGGPVVIDAAKRKYKLNSLFHDTTLMDKLQISARRMQSAKRLALTDPAGAARMLTAYLRAHGFPNVDVLAGDYARTTNNAVEFIRSMGRTIVYKDSCARASVFHDRLEISYDQFELNDVIWSVYGPLKYATEVNIVYQMAIHYGPEQVLFMLGEETLRLGIDIRNEITGLCYTGALHGYSSLAGIKPAGHSFPPELTADQQARLLLAGRKISPIHVGGAVIGTAVHVSDKHAILNEHTLALAAQNDVVPEVCGEFIDESMSVSGDVCVIKRDGDHAQWQFREPQVGERVVLCYSVGEAVEYSEVLQVMGSADQLILSDSNILRKGASGAAVVALRDSALLGIFSTMRGKRVFCAPFTPTSFAIVSDCQSVVSASQYAATPGVDAGDHTYAKMVKRGFLGFLEQIDKSVAPLYSTDRGERRMAGLVANVGGDWLTTVNPDISQLTMADARMLSFDVVSSAVYTVRSPPPVLQAVPISREVVPGERVFVFTKVDDSVIMSSVRMVTHCMAGGKSFVVDDFGDSNEEMVGGLIVAERDAAVVGLYLERDCDSFGKFSVQCVPVVVSVVGTQVADMRSVGDHVLNEVLSSDSSFRAHVAYGQHVWSVILGGVMFHGDGHLLDSVDTSVDMWRNKCRAILVALAWPAGHDDVLRRLGYENVAYALLAASYLRDSKFVIDHVQVIVRGDMDVHVEEDIGYPFPRPVTADTVNSRGTMSTPDSARLSEMEMQIAALTKMMIERDRGG